MSQISIKGARTHNLKNVDVTIPRDKLVVITGLSGSGKSSLAFDTLYAEGQRRYVESLSAYARQFLSVMEKPDVDSIEGLSPAISIEQKATSHNPRSTVGTITEIYDYMRLLFARIGQPKCPDHGVVLEAQTISQMVDTVLALPESTALLLLAPVVVGRKGEHLKLIEQFRAQGFVRMRVDGEVYDIDEVPKLNPKTKHDIDVVVDRFKVKPDISQRLAESFETAVRITDGNARVVNMKLDGDDKKTQAVDLLFSSKFACPHCGYSLSELSPRLFSFNNPAGACDSCSGLGTMQFIDPEKILVDESLSVAGGAIRGWGRRHYYYFQMMTSLAKHYDFDVETPYEELDDDIKDILLYGSDDEKIKFTYVNHRNRRRVRTQPFEGVVHTMERRYRETDSDTVREELAKYLASKACSECEGSRLCLPARHVFIADMNLPEMTAMNVRALMDSLTSLTLKGQRATIADKILKEITARLQFLISVGLNYLTLHRSAETLSGGEAQRIRLASQIGSGLVGVMYVLDEPSIGLHQRDNDRLLGTLTHLRDLGNSVIVVEHDEDAIRHADHIIDMGPGPGVHGGAVVAQGAPKDIIASEDSLTGKYLSGQCCIAVPKNRHVYDPKRVIRLQGAECNNLNKVNISVPVGLLTCVTGVSGSGKSSLINDTLFPIVANKLNKQSSRRPGKYKSIAGLGHLDKVVDIDQSPIGRTPRSNPATYTGLFTPIRELFAGTQEARSRGYKVGRFSFNVKGGRCEACQGDGLIKVEMHFLSDVYVTCDVCKGKRYNRETLDILYKGKNIYEVLSMTVEDAREFFENIPSLVKKLDTLMDVGLSYIHIGQSATTLSGGEAQRVKLSRELSKRDTGNTLYLLDEPTTGLHFHDVNQLLLVLQALRDRGNTVVIIEHNLDVIKTADWIIDLGPEGGDGGGEIIATGAPDDIVKVKGSYTGKYLKQHLK